MSGLFSWLVGTPCHAPSSHCPALTKHHIVSGFHIKKLDHSDFPFACLCCLTYFWEGIHNCWLSTWDILLPGYTWPGLQTCRGCILGTAKYAANTSCNAHDSAPENHQPKCPVLDREAAVFAITFLVNVLFFPQSMIPTLSNMCMGKKRKD